jgi:hypothetical protein
MGPASGTGRWRGRSGESDTATPPRARSCTRAARLLDGRPRLSVTVAGSAPTLPNAACGGALWPRVERAAAFLSTASEPANARPRAAELRQRREHWRRAGVSRPCQLACYSEAIVAGRQRARERRAALADVKKAREGKRRRAHPRATLTAQAERPPSRRSPRTKAEIGRARR